MAKTPNCNHCKTDDFLVFSNFVPGHHETLSLGRAWGGQEVNRTRWIGPVVEFTCLKCGHFNGHTVPDDWSLPESNPKRRPDSGVIA